MAEVPSVELLADFRPQRSGRVFAIGSIAIEQWDSTPEDIQESMTQRALMVDIASADGRPMNKSKVRWLQGKAKGAVELKTQNPEYRGIGFKRRGDWYLSYIGPKPRERDVVKIARDALQLQIRLFGTAND